MKTVYIVMADNGADRDLIEVHPLAAPEVSAKADKPLDSRLTLDVLRRIDPIPLGRRFFSALFGTEGRALAGADTLGFRVGDVFGNEFLLGHLVPLSLLISYASIIARDSHNARVIWVI